MCVREERWLTRVTTRVVTNVNADVEPATEQNNTRTTTTERALRSRETNHDEKVQMIPYWFRSDRTWSEEERRVESR